MAAATNDWTGTNGAGITTGMTGDGGSWSIPAATGATYSTLQAHSGTTSARHGNDAFLDIREYRTIATGGYFRMYCHLPVAPTGSTDITFCVTAGGGDWRWIGVDASRRLYVVNNSTTDTLRYASSTSSYKAQSSANVVPLNEWFRIEGRIDTTAVEAKIWTASGAGIESNGTPDATVTTTGSGGSIADVRLGHLSYHSGALEKPLGVGNYIYTDSWAWDTAGWIGALYPPASGTSFAGIVPI